ncbi:MAG TPA: SPFH domain-containing protein [Thermoleophilaceae bacterium]
MERANLLRRYGLFGAVAGFVGLVGAIVLVAGLFSFKSVDQGHVCVVVDGGPLDDRKVSKVRQPGSAVETVGIFNHQRCFPANERHYTLSSDPAAADSKTVDVVKVPTKDAVEVYVEGQFRFRLTTDEGTLKDFYRRYGSRTFAGTHPYDGDEGWNNFLAQVFRQPSLTATREAVGRYRCIELRNTCQYVTNAQAAVSGGVREVETGQNLEKVAEEIGRTTETRLNEFLSGTCQRPDGPDPGAAPDEGPCRRYFVAVRFTLGQPHFEDSVEKSVTAAQTAGADAATARLQAQKKVEEARGRRRVSEEDAKAIRETGSAYRRNPVKGRIDLAEAICGVEDDGRPKGCPVQSFGGNSSLLLNPREP